MKKRLLCYDEDNPIGIDENGVLNPSALGGGEPDLVVTIDCGNSDFIGDEITESLGTYTDVYGNFEQAVEKLKNGTDATVWVKCRFVYASRTYYSLIKNPTMVLVETKNNEYDKYYQIRCEFTMNTGYLINGPHHCVSITKGPLVSGVKTNQN